MKKFVVLVLLLCVVPLSCYADVNDDAVSMAAHPPATVPLGGAEYVTVIQNGIVKKATIDELYCTVNPSHPTIFQSGIPFIKASSGTMGNNGAISAMTALPVTYSAGAYIWLPAGAVAAGVPAAPTWYWFVASSATAGTVYNNIYTTGQPSPPAVNTPFATTGPGAYTGDTGTITGPIFTVVANLLGIHGRIDAHSILEYAPTAGSKTSKIRFGGTDCWTQSTTTGASMMGNCVINNRGTLTRQMVGYFDIRSGAVSNSGMLVEGVINTALDTTVSFVASTAVATDHVVIDGARVLITPQY